MRAATLSDRLRGWQRRLRQLARRSTTDSQMSAEVAFHFDMETQKKLRIGVRVELHRSNASLNRINAGGREVRGTVDPADGAGLRQ